jgi:tetratricopeptide (TPR) repeat protein
MSRPNLIISLLLAGAALGFAVGVEVPLGAQEASRDTREITDSEIATAMDLLMQSRTDEALAYLDGLAGDCSGEPLYLITRGRLLLETIPVDDDQKDYTKEVSEPVLSVFDKVIETCSNRMDDGGTDPNLWLYRGWAWMQKSHIRALGRSFYTAGRDAGRGKDDLEKYLAEDPDNPSANGLLGAFLYFTDAIPSIFKFLSKLLFLPTGDRDRGLDMIRRAAEQYDPFEPDYMRLLNNVHVYFEGRYEEGLEGTLALVKAYPAHPRPAITLATAGPFVPIERTVFRAGTDRVIAGLLDGDPARIDWGSLNTARAAQAYADRLLGDPALAAERFRAILGDSPERPDWVMGFAQFQLGQIHAGQGRRDLAREMLESVKSGDDERFRKYAEKTLDDLDEYSQWVESPPEGPEGGWIEAIYRVGTDSLEVIASKCEALARSSPRAAFYAGECRLLLGDVQAAFTLYGKVIAWEAPAWEFAYQMIACARMAEIMALSGDYQRAAEYQRRALDYYQGEYRVDWMLEGRQQYFQRLAAGDVQGPPPALRSISH